MSTRSKKRRSTLRSHETETPKPKPRGRALQRVLKTPAPASTSKKRQETLTQIGFVVYQNSEDMDLNFDEDANEDREETPRARKRRKIGKEPAIPVTRQTRSSARRAAERTLKDEEDEENLKLELDENRIPLEQASRALMPPPKTPQSTRQKEVPSSQSPADTPLSTQSQKSQRDLARSPLKNRSTNVRRVNIADSSARTSIRRAQMLEVADSTEFDEEERQPSIPAPEMTSSIPIKYELRDDSTRTSGTSSTLPSSGIEVVACPQQESLNGDVEDASAPRTQNIKSEVSDSEADEEDDEDFRAGIDTQAALGITDTQPNNINTNNDLIPITNTWTSGRTLNTSRPATISKQRDRQSEHSSINLDQEPNVSATSLASITQSSFPQLCNDPTTPKCSMRAMAPSSSTRSAPRSESEEVSIQLADDLHSHTQNYMMPETESQLENAWHEYKPTQPPSDEDRDPSQPDGSHLSSLAPRALDSEAIERNPPFDEAQVPIPQPCTALPSSNPPQHPSSTAANQPSQTTTDDTTPSSSAHRSSPNPYSSSPPQPPFSTFSSSPVQSRAAAAAASAYAGEWDGVPLTESQLLPDSLMNETLVGPPSLEGDEWESEGDG